MIIFLSPILHGLSLPKSLQWVSHQQVQCQSFTSTFIGHSSRGPNPPFHLPNDSCCSAAVKSLQSCLTLCDPIDGSPPGSSVPGILQARMLEQVAISFFWPLIVFFFQIHLFFIPFHFPCLWSSNDTSFKLPSSILKGPYSTFLKTHSILSSSKSPYVCPVPPHPF